MDWGKVVLLTSGIGIQQKSPLSFGWFNQLVSCQFLFVPFNSDHNRNEDQMLFAGWMIWCLDEEVLKKLISLCWHQFDWRARGWLCRPWRPPCHCWPLSSRSKHSSLRALSLCLLSWPDPQGPFIISRSDLPQVHWDKHYSNEDWKSFIHGIRQNRTNI